MKRVAIESPCNAATHEGLEENLEYARRCLQDSIRRGEAPYASHLLLTQVLDDLVEEERQRGMEVGAAWDAHAELVALYTDRGISRGMFAAMERAKERGIPWEYRSLRCICDDYAAVTGFLHPDCPQHGEVRRG